MIEIYLKKNTLIKIDDVTVGEISVSGAFVRFDHQWISSQEIIELAEKLKQLDEPNKAEAQEID